MSLRLINLPADLRPLAKMLPEAFHYPENESWNLKSDEKEQLVAAINNLSRLWPLIRLIQRLSPALRDIMRGCVWEEEGQIVGTTMVQRRGSTDVWMVGTVGVLPAYRRQGIARELMEAGLDLICAHGGTKAILNVIEGNLPACALYEGLGFEHYSGIVNFQATPETAPPAPVFPKGYTQSPLARFDWETLYQLEKRISPASLLMYEPAEVDRFRQPVMARLLLPLILFAQGTREQEFAIHTSTEGTVVARGGYSIPTRDKGLNTVWARLDPAHPDLAPYLVQYLVHRVMTLSPGRRVEFPVPLWMDALVTAVEGADFERRLEHRRMGLVLWPGVTFRGITEKR